MFEIADKNKATFAVKNPNLGVQYTDLMKFFSIPMNPNTFAKYVSVYLNMHPSVRDELIRVCGSTIEVEYERIHGKPEPPQGKLLAVKAKAREVLTTINLIHPLVFKKEKSVTLTAFNGRIKMVHS